MIVLLLLSVAGMFAAAAGPPAVSGIRTWR
jgi:hypothetical protein